MSASVRVAEVSDTPRLAALSRGAKLTYLAWAPHGWQPPSFAVERARWERRLNEPAGWTVLATRAEGVLGAVHVTDAREEQGDGSSVPARAHLSGLFVQRSRWGEGIGSQLLAAAMSEMRERGYADAELFTAEANARSRAFYEARRWRVAAADPAQHDGLTLIGYGRVVQRR